ncbi:MAG: molybdopterin oxidoreductase [Oligoflexia bacterium]
MQASHSVQNPGKFEVPARVRTLFVVMLVAGIGAAFAAYLKEPSRFWPALVHNHFYFLSLAVGGLFFAAIQWVTGAMWSAPVRRLAESFTSFLPWLLVTFAVLYFGLNHLYKWTNQELVAGDIMLSGKQAYLNKPFFIIRNVLGIAIWMIFAKVMIGNSIKQDETKDPALTGRNRVFGPIFLMLFAITFTLTAFDLLMSLDPYWFSTMFGVYCFAGLFYSTLALVTIITVYLKRKGALEGIINENHLHDLGKFMFAFTVFWAYIGFSQFMLIWYANLPEETGYFLHRMTPTWKAVSAFLLFGKFFAVFVMLLPRGNKRDHRVLWGVGWFMMVAQWIDILWLIQPEFFDAPKFGWVEAGVLAAFVGGFGLSVFRFLGRNNIVAIGDPKLHESLHHHHQ